MKMDSLDTTIVGEISEYLTLVKKLEYSPNSKRIFSEVHSASMELLDKFGVTEGNWSKKKRVYEFINVDNQIGLKIEYSRYNLTSKFLEISYITEDGAKKTFDLMTSLGIQNIRELESGDEVTRISRGGMGITSREGLRKIVDALTKFQPDRLLMYNNGTLVRESVYGK